MGAYAALVEVHGRLVLALCTREVRDGARGWHRDRAKARTLGMA